MTTSITAGLASVVGMALYRIMRAPLESAIFEMTRCWTWSTLQMFKTIRGNQRKPYRKAARSHEAALRTPGGLGHGHLQIHLGSVCGCQKADSIMRRKVRKNSGILPRKIVQNYIRPPRIYLWSTQQIRTDPTLLEDLMAIVPLSERIKFV